MFILPKEFPEIYFESVSKQMSKYANSSQKDIFVEFAGGWHGVMYRFISCAESNIQFIASIDRASSAPVPEERYLQENNLFIFYSSGLSLIECFCYSLYAICSLLNPIMYSFFSEDDKRRVNPYLLSETLNQIHSIYKEDDIAIYLKSLIEENIFKDWRVIRNTISHRVSPRRKHYTGGEKNGKADWICNREIDRWLTCKDFKWLCFVLERLLQKTDLFAMKYLN